VSFAHPEKNLPLRFDGSGRGEMAARRLLPFDGLEFT
jgi:hypothetical protein